MKFTEADIAGMTRQEVAKLFDHTFLDPAGHFWGVEKVCEEALDWRFWSVMVHPSAVAECAERLKGSGVKVGSVVDFPFGMSTMEAKEAEGLSAIRAGAEELDLVVNGLELRFLDDKEGWLDGGAGRPLGFEKMAGDYRRFVEKMRAESPDVKLKLIIECCNLKPEGVVTGTQLAKAAGFDFAKTSSGFGKSGAKEEDVAAMAAAADGIGVKAAGGIRDWAGAKAMLLAGATRLGSSASADIMWQFLSWKAGL